MLVRSLLRAFAVGSLAVACSSPVRNEAPARPEAPEPTSAPPLALSASSSATAPPPLQSAATTSPPPPEREESPRPETLAGITCSIRGGGAPFPVPCDPNQVKVFPKRQGTKLLAQFDAEEIDVTWGLFEDAGRASIHARSGGIALTGFADTNAMVFRLRREVTILADHVWLKQDAPLKIRRGLTNGASVEVLADLPGVAKIPAHVLCDAIAFDPVDDEAPREPAAAPLREMAQIALLHPKNPTLRLREAPGGRVITTLSGPLGETAIGGSNILPKYDALDLEVVEERGDARRVRFETEFARFDVWIDASAAESRGTGSGVMGGRGCGGSRDHMAKRRRVNALTPIHVGKTPSGASGAELVVMKGTFVAVAEEKDGFVAIVPFSSIYPPTDASFWIPKSALD